MERLTRSKQGAAGAVGPEADVPVTACDNGSFVPCAPSAESISACAGRGGKDAEDCARRDARKDRFGNAYGRNFSAAEELACVLLFGHTMSELVDAEEISGSE